MKELNCQKEQTKMIKTLPQNVQLYIGRYKQRNEWKVVCLT